MEYTRGEWKVRKANPKYLADNCTEIIIAGSGAKIAKMDDGWSNLEIKANAQLISVAPDLYEALKGLIDILGNTWNQEDYRDEFNKAFQAIAKAEGGK